MKLKLNASQLSFLAFVQIPDDWHHSAFANTIIDNYKDKFSGDDAAFEQMRQELLNLSEEKMTQLQLALGLLGELNWES